MTPQIRKKLATIIASLEGSIAHAERMLQSDLSVSWRQAYEKQIAQDRRWLGNLQRHITDERRWNINGRLFGTQDAADRYAETHGYVILEWIAEGDERVADFEYLIDA